MGLFGRGRANNNSGGGGRAIPKGERKRLSRKALETFESIEESDAREDAAWERFLRGEDGK